LSVFSARHHSTPAKYGIPANLPGGHPIENIAFPNALRGDSGGQDLHEAGNGTQVGRDDNDLPAGVQLIKAHGNSLTASIGDRRNFDNIPFNSAAFTNLGAAEQGHILRNLAAHSLARLGDIGRDRSP
jgi:hypothetical protein